MANKKTTTKVKTHTRKAVPKSAKKTTTATRRTKAPVRKTVKRRKAPATTALPAAMAHEAFWVANGEILHTVADLAEVLQDIDENTFRHHVNHSKNDFATWVEEVLGETACATDLRRAKTPRSARTATLKCLRNYA